jgi:hypothetical protein
MFRSLKPLKILSKSFLAGLNKKEILIEPAQVKELTTKHLQQFMLEFYSRNASDFVTKNVSKQRQLLFSSPVPEFVESEPSLKSSVAHSESVRVEASDLTPTKPKRTISRGSPPSKRAKRQEEIKAVDTKSIDKAIQRLTAIVETQSKKFGAMEGAVKFTHTKMESSIGDLGKKLNSLEQRISKLDKKVQACQKQNEERLEKLESRLNTAIRSAEQASVEANAAREGFVNHKTDFAAKLQLLQDQVQQQLDQLQKATSDVVANHTKRQDETVSEKLRTETELTSTLSTLTNLVERQGQQLAHLVQNSVSTSQPQQQASPLQIPQMIVGQQPYTGYSNAPQMVAPQFLPPQSTVTYQQQPHWPMPTENGAELSRLFRHLRNYPGFNSFQ